MGRKSKVKRKSNLQDWNNGDRDAAQERGPTGDVRAVCDEAAAHNNAAAPAAAAAASSAGCVAAAQDAVAAANPSAANRAAEAERVADAAEAVRLERLARDEADGLAFARNNKACHSRLEGSGKAARVSSPSLPQTEAQTGGWVLQRPKRVSATPRQNPAARRASVAPATRDGRGKTTSPASLRSLRQMHYAYAHLDLVTSTYHVILWRTRTR